MHGALLWTTSSQTVIGMELLSGVDGNLALKVLSDVARYGNRSVLSSAEGFEKPLRELGLIWKYYCAMAMSYR